jgi:hypothetical protein
MRIFGILSISALVSTATISDSLAQTKVKASDVVINGESFFAAANITAELTRLARADGYIGSSESFRQIAVSGAVMTGILNQYKSCTPKPVYVITDGGGNDLMGSCGGTPTPNCTSIKNALGTVQQYFDEMKASGTKKVIWMRYPDPQGSNWATLKANQDVYNPEVEKICKASTEPKCQWIDMRPVWEGHYAQYTSDGIHPTTAGGTATAEAFWKAAKESGFFESASTKAEAAIDPGISAFRGHRVTDRSLALSLFLDHPAPVSMRLATLSGKSVLAAGTHEGPGFRTVQYRLGSIPPGLYILDVRVGQSAQRATVSVP